MMSGANNDVSLDNPPAFVAQAMTSSEVSDEFIMQSDVDNIEFTSDMAEEYTDIESFAKDFGYKFEDQYSNIDI